MINVGDTVKWMLPNHKYKIGEVVAIVFKNEHMCPLLPDKFKGDIKTDVSKFDRALVITKGEKRTYYSPKLQSLNHVDTNVTVYDDIIKNRESLCKALMKESDSGDGCPPKKDWTCEEIEGECEICWSRYLCMPAE